MMIYVLENKIVFKNNVFEKIKFINVFYDFLKFFFKSHVNKYDLNKWRIPSLIKLTP